MAVVTIQQSVAALYVAVFNRAPDQAGLNAWTNAITSGQSTFAQVAAGFAAHEVFTTGIGALSNTAYVAALYTNILGSAGDAAGIANWTAQLNAGQSKAAVAALFVQAALTVDIPAMLAAGSLTAAEAAAATVRQDTLTNKANTGIYFAETLKAASNLNPLTVQSSKAGLEADPIYNASKAAIANVTNTAASVQSAKDAISVAAGTANPAQSLLGGTFTLTTGSDVLVGGAGNDTFTAGEVAGVAALTVGDQINGGAGNDTLNWIQTGAITGVPTGVTVSSVETVNVTSGGAITLNTTAGFTGTTSLKTTTSGAAQAITAAADQNVTAVAAAQAATAVAINGGKDVVVTATGVAAGLTTVGATTAAAGTVTVNSTVSGIAAPQGAIAVTGGTSVNVTTATSNAVNTTATQAAVTVTGNASTTAVTVNQDKAATAAATVVGKVNGAVVVTDVNAASATAAGTIATVSLNSYANSSIDSSALTAVNLAGTGGTLSIGRGDLTATPTANTLALNVNGLTAGTITDAEAAADNGFTTINIASTGTASTVAGLVAVDATALNISGDAKVTLTANTLTAVKDITVTNTAGAALGTALATDVKFTGGAGADEISIGATTKAITLGAGNDVVILSSAALGAGGTLAGGEGTDTLVANTNGSSFIADPAFSGFETLRVAGLAAQGSHNANGFTALEVGALAASATFTNVAANVGLTVLATPGFATNVVLANATGTADVFNLTLKSDSDIAANTISLAGVETVNISNIDTLTTTASGINTNSLTLTDAAAKSVVVTGNAGLTLTATGSTAITNFDASGVTGDAANAVALAVTYTSLNTTVGENVSIKGGSGNDVLTGSASANDTIVGGAGNDTLAYTGGTDVFTGGTGADIFDINAVGTKASHLTITDATKTDTLDFVGITQGILANVNAAGMVTAKVTLGAGATLDQYLDAAAAADGGTNAVFSWFQQGGNTYAVVDNTSGAAFAVTDAVIQLTGLVDLSTSSITGEVLTFA